MVSFYSFAADLVAAFHFLYVIFAVGGQVCILAGAVLKWRWVRNPVFRTIHLAAVGLVALEAVIGMLCPLTRWEYDLRALAGQAAERNLSFIARLVRLVIYYDFPDWIFTALHISFGLLVAATFVFVPPRFRRHGSDNVRTGGKEP